jgi:hypothetical protein
MHLINNNRSAFLKARVDILLNLLALDIARYANADIYPHFERR